MVTNFFQGCDRFIKYLLSTKIFRQSAPNELLSRPSSYHQPKEENDL
ncbi:MAG: hypothetical protein ACRC1Z_03795 [Waterburya sp.]